MCIFNTSLHTLYISYIFTYILMYVYISTYLLHLMLFYILYLIYLYIPCTARSVEDETRNAELNGNRNPEWWGDFSQTKISI